MHHPTDRIVHTMAFVTPVMMVGKVERNVLVNEIYNTVIWEPWNVGMKRMFSYTKFQQIFI